MNVILRPAGPQPPQVYWTRRLVVLGGIILLIMIVWAVAARGGGDPAAAQPEDEVLAGDSDAEPTEAPATGTKTCTAADLQLTVTTDTRAYPAGAFPAFTVTITNIGGTSCAIDAGEAQREILITSGSDRIWSSHDCLAPDAPERLLLLAAGDADEPTTVSWQRVRSNPECTSDLPAPRPGTYRAVATLAGAESEPAVFDLG